MKKTIIFSLLLNITLLLTTILLFNKYSELKQDAITNQKKVVTKEKFKTKSFIDKIDPVYIYYSHKFSCDSGYTSLEINLCSFEKLNFANSLLNELVNSELNKLDDLIKRNKEEVLKTKDNTFFANCLRINTSEKEEFMKSQKLWEEIRRSNSKIFNIGCDTGTGCVGIVNEAEIKDVLSRIKKNKRNGFRSELKHI